MLHTVGYENSSFFHNKFKELYGKTPKEYRREKAAASLGDSNSFSNDV
ncbi:MULTISPECIES: AraC family transcriptional regulator [Lachnospiraceae]|uniref:AraC family transcriptional regulator n=3 Tax=Lachnospiraceae TaxID=186803 RepID=A0A3R6AIX8_9FIRM|nr:MULTISPECIES: AraC family transcriptional regulator [Lachnospiraceae]MBS6946459.1 AraC family transcriptional regulator [Ruminococcus sp.]MBT9840261.1 AraC family transcriptional regulator [Blautia sp. MCC283]RGK00735.1 AraC family transcriptional regulator [Mediterraneibacter gnavus]RHF90992.1 AraC family transcriptional regulator [Roseburia sp. AM23-20]RJW17434.1 AraC family transcriptional regulator [Lachnospiraceae bacterium TM07-2AC]